MYRAFSGDFLRGSGSHIDRLNMDGKGGRIHVIEGGLHKEFISLHYDEDLHRIFWTDLFSADEIASTEVDGKNTVHKKIYFPLFFETYLSLYMHSK
jgi:hypothetical protein